MVAHRAKLGKILIAVCALLIARPAYADTPALGNGGGVPCVTGSAPITVTNCTALTFATAPAISGANFTAGTIPDSALSSTFLKSISVGLTAPAIFSVSGSPAGASGTLGLSLANQSANLVWAGPSTGAAAAPTFRSLVSSDIPALAYVTSVGLSLPGIFSVSGSPVTSNGTLTGTLANQNANLIWAGPSSGGAAAPTFRSLVSADIPSLSYVTSVGLTMPADFSVSGSPVTGSGTLAVTAATQTANTVKAGPSSGAAAAPTYRALVPADGAVPTFTAAGAVVASTYHCIYDTVTAGGTTTTITLSGAAAYSNANWSLIIRNETAWNTIQPSGKTSNSVTFTSVLSTVYSIHACGV